MGFRSCDHSFSNIVPQPLAIFNVSRVLGKDGHRACHITVLGANAILEKGRWPRGKEIATLATHRINEGKELPWQISQEFLEEIQNAASKEQADGISQVTIAVSEMELYRLSLGRMLNFFSGIVLKLSGKI